MHIVHQSPTELIVKDSNLWMSVICASAALASAVFAIARAELQAFFAAGVFLVFAAITARGMTFTFDGLKRVGRFKGYWLFKTKTGTVRFDDIADITVDAMSTDTNATTYRLVLQTVNGPVPLADAYSASPDSYAALRRQILAFLKPGLDPAHEAQGKPDDIPADLWSSLQVLLIERRKIDAIALLRRRQALSLAEAKKRIDRIDIKIKAGRPSARL